MFCWDVKMTEIPGTVLADVRKRWITWVAVSPRSALGLSAIDMRPLLAVAGPNPPTLELM